MSDLTDFLLARIAEDEGRSTGYSSGDDPDWMWGPARVLAECEAKRRIVELHALVTSTMGPCGCSSCGETHGPTMPPACQECSTSGQHGCTTSRLLALPYADHPDYREEWRP